VEENTRRKVSSIWRLLVKLILLAKTESEAAMVVEVAEAVIIVVVKTNLLLLQTIVMAIAIVRLEKII
jgi:hypothetical protein